MSINSETFVADGAVTRGRVIKATGYNTTVSKRSPKGALSAAGTAKHVGISKRTVADLIHFEVQTSGVCAFAVAGGVLTLGTEYWLTSDASGKLVAAVHGDNVIAKLLKINKGGAASADGDEITVEIVSFFLAVDN